MKSVTYSASFKHDTTAPHGTVGGGCHVLSFVLFASFIGRGHSFKFGFGLLILTHHKDLFYLVIISWG